MADAPELMSERFSEEEILEIYHRMCSVRVATPVKTIAEI